MVEITGVQSTSKHKEGDYERIIIEKYCIVKKIPPVIVICEDVLAEHIIQNIDEINLGSMKIIRAGSWNNFSTLLYGINFYKKYSFKNNELDVICVVDGDILEENILEKISQTHSGSFTSNNQEFKEIINSLHLQIVSFDLESNNGSLITGIPEFNHKKWLDDISDECIFNVFKEKLENLDKIISEGLSCECLNYAKLEKIRIEQEINEVKRIINASRSIEFQTKQQQKIMKKVKTYQKGILLKRQKNLKIDYHRFYNQLSHLLQKGDTFRYYRINKTDDKETREEEIQNAVFAIIKRFNKEKWDKYVFNVKNRILTSIENHQNRFSKDYFNNEEI